MTLAEKLCMWKFEGAGLRTLPHRNYLGWKCSITSLKNERNTGAGCAIAHQPVLPRLDPRPALRQ